MTGPRSPKQCLNCKKYTKKVITFAIFPTESFKWCSEKCLFIWVLKHDVKVDDHIIDEIESRKGRKFFMSDLVKIEDLD